MNIAEKLVAITDNVPMVYYNGYGNGEHDGHIRGYAEGHTAGYDEGYGEGYDEGYDEGYEAGQTAGGGTDPTPRQEKTVNITNNGTVEVTPDGGYVLEKVTVNVNVPSPPFQNKIVNITKNGTVKVTPDEDCVLSEVIVNVNVQASGAEPVIEELTITKNGTHTASDGVNGYSPVIVNVPDFWDVFQENGNRTNYTQCFNGPWWTDETFKPKHTIKPQKCTYMFQGSQITNVSNFMIDFSEKTNSNDTTRPFDESAIKTIGTINLSNISGSLNTFFAYGNENNSNLVTIQNLILSDKNTFGGNFFQNCVKLENITISGKINATLSIKYSELLTKSSIKSILGALSENGSGKVLELNTKAVDEAFKNGDVVGSSTKEWQDEIKNPTKNGWTITLKQKTDK